jgi:hypothetical protein
MVRRSLRFESGRGIKIPAKRPLLRTRESLLVREGSRIESATGLKTPSKSAFISRRPYARTNAMAAIGFIAALGL